MKKPISILQYITTSAELAEKACMGGVDWIQLRLKNISYEDYRTEALKVQEVCNKYNATLIINDNVALALDINADGVHVGKEDPLTPEHIEALLAGGYIIGCTANTIEDFVHLSAKPVDYIGLGPFRFTTTKNNLSPILGTEGYKRIFDALREKQIIAPPVIAIGGVTRSDVPALMATEIHGIAVSGAITNAKDITTTALILKNVTSKTNTVVHKTININAPVAKVWDALTNPTLMKYWLSDNEVIVTSDWKENSPITFKGMWNGSDYTDKGTIFQLIPEKTFSYTYWNKLSQLPDEPTNYTLIKFTLMPKEDHTVLALKQSNFILEATFAHWNYYWNITLDRMKKLIEKQ